MAPPLDRRDLYERKWKSRPSSFFRVPRRTRRATYLCWVFLVFLFYFGVKSLTSWSVPSPAFFEQQVKLIPIRFPYLYRTLSPGGWGRKATVFAAGNLEAASKLAGMACEMGSYRRSNVHLVLLGFDTLPIDEFRRINGIADDEDCNVRFHNARAEFSEVLPHERQVVAVKSALRHVSDFLHPQAVIVDPAHEEEWFMEIAREKAKQIRTTLIELPEEHMHELRWMTRLDSGSLSAWHKPSFEVVIYADTHTGNLERLLKSLEAAYYPTPEHHPSHITIVLHPSVSLPSLTAEYLKSYAFPSRTRISLKRPLLPSSTPEDAATRFIESFYPHNEDTSLLVLDTNTELSKWYYQYLLYATLEYRYATYLPSDADGLFGISLEDPPAHLSGDAPFTTPQPNGPYLYPATNPRAALYFPEHWAEFHAYYSHRLRGFAPAPPNASYTPPALELSPAVAGSWQKPFLELVRARGYTMLYPGFSREALATVHNEQPSYTRHQSTHRPVEKPLMERSGFLEELPEEELPAWNELPLLDLWGKRTGWTEFDLAARGYRGSISSCPDEKGGVAFTVQDLFCDGDGNYVP